MKEKIGFIVLILLSAIFTFYNFLYINNIAKKYKKEQDKIEYQLELNSQPQF